MFRTMSVRLKRAASVFCLLSIIFRQLRPIFCLIRQQFPICHLSTQKLPKNRQWCQMRLKVENKKMENQVNPTMWIPKLSLESKFLLPISIWHFFNVISIIFVRLIYLMLLPLYCGYFFSIFADEGIFTTFPLIWPKVILKGIQDKNSVANFWLTNFSIFLQLIFSSYISCKK